MVRSEGNRHKANAKTGGASCGAAMVPLYSRVITSSHPMLSRSHKIGFVSIEQDSSDKDRAQVFQQVCCYDTTTRLCAFGSYENVTSSCLAARLRD